VSLTKVSPSLFQVSNNITSVTVGGSANTISLTFDSNGVITGATNNAVSVANTAITGTITAAQIAAVSNTAITGLIQAAQIGSANATLVTSGTLPKARLPAGSVLQVVQNTTATLASTTSSASFVDTTLTASITPTSATSQILVLIMQNIQVTNQGSPYATGMWQLLRGASAIYTPYSTDNGNVFAYDYGGSGINVYRPTPITWLDSPNTTSSTTYKTQVKLGTNGGASIAANAGAVASITLLEIAA
jgi:hypothetical protein